METSHHQEGAVVNYLFPLARSVLERRSSFSFAHSNNDAAAEEYADFLKYFQQLEETKEYKANVDDRPGTRVYIIAVHKAWAEPVFPPGQEAEAAAFRSCQAVMGNKLPKYRDFSSSRWKIMKQCILYALGLIPTIEDVLEGRLLEEVEAAQSTDQLTDGKTMHHEDNEPNQSRYQDKIGGLVEAIGRSIRIRKGRPGLAIPGGSGLLPHLIIP
ncbi:MAG: hypothetical protein M1816_007713 [Peltula sp. TS41687]|nr:MAG: hypothetical protein M1816_007713 [Peltula sp. TS41687]